MKQLSHGALTAIIGENAAKADATVTVPRAVFEAAVLKQRDIPRSSKAATRR